jgi:hypothetical protein
LTNPMPNAPVLTMYCLKLSEFGFGFGFRFEAIQKYWGTIFESLAIQDRWFERRWKSSSAQVSSAKDKSDLVKILQQGFADLVVPR